MTEEKIIDTNKQPQEVFAEERLSDDELDNMAGGTGKDLNACKLISKSVSVISDYNSDPGGK